jgi:ketosteroid isomerase-like protein
MVEFAHGAAGAPNAAKDLVLEFLRALEQEGNVAAMRYATQDFTWWHPLMGDTGRGGMAAFDAAIARMFAGPARLKVHNVIAENERVAVELEMAIAMKDGRTYCNQYHFLFFVRGSHVHRLKEYNNTAYAAQMLSLPASSPRA